MKQKIDASPAEGKSLGQIAEDAYTEALQTHESDSHEYCMQRAAEAVAQAVAAEKDKEIERLKELCICQLAGISTASVQNTQTTIRDRINQDSLYWSVAYQDVCVAIDREMRERERAESAEARVKELEEQKEVFLRVEEQHKKDFGSVTHAIAAITAERDSLRQQLATARADERRACVERVRFVDPQKLLDAYSQSGGYFEGRNTVLRLYTQAILSPEESQPQEPAIKDSLTAQEVAEWGKWKKEFELIANGIGGYSLTWSDGEYTAPKTQEAWIFYQSVKKA